MNSADLVRENVRRILEANRVAGKKPSNQNELADQIGVGRQAVSKRMREGADMDVSSVAAFAAALEVEIWRLFAPPGAAPVDDSLDRDPTMREFARFVRWLLRTEGAVAYLEDLIGKALEKTKKRKA